MARMDLPVPLPLARIAEIVDGNLFGDPAITVSGISEVSVAQPDDLVFAWTKPAAAQAFAGAAAAVVVSPDLARPDKPHIVVSNPRLAMAKLLSTLLPPEFPSPEIRPTAVIGKGVKLGDGVFIGDYAVIGDETEIGDGTLVFPHAVIGRRVRIGRHCRIYPHVTIYDGVVIGNRVIIHAGAVIGKDGFGFVWDGTQHFRIPQIGTVIIEDDVEIGANSCIDRATLGETRIGKGTKIDNLVQIAHNCVLGAHCVLAGQVGLAGSVQVGNGVLMGGQVGIADHVQIGNGVVLLAKSGLMDNAPAHSQWAGYPARPRSQWLRVEAALPQLPDALKLLRQLTQRVEQLEQRLTDQQGREKPNDESKQG